MNLAFLTGSVLLWAGLQAGVAQAQVLGRSEASTAEQRLIEDLGPERVSTATPLNSLDARNLAELTQSGTSNAATITQNYTAGNQNQAFILQVGQYNLADITQTGAGNTTSVSQNGSFNQAELNVTGTNNDIDVMQNGERNKVLGTVSANDRQYQVTQTGNDNVLTQLETTRQSPQGYSIEMRGQGIRVSVEQGRVTTP
ncbi:hypothetical protein [Hymenobacter cavernae]|uniref:Curlin n=1 Tax=Hymenobacter cavernae TaxID=2044852 RepID=A0ABQ1TJH7_9BACT|nr:hypothetical protein [Hymenobacter cavernae]GGE97081.1 hypothetical protein GCM10011383_04770 [Hymenobacter cavernae]